MGIFMRENIGETLNGIIKIGEVCEVDYTDCTARVVFDDDNGMVSNKLQVVQRNTYKNHDVVLPDIGEDVICIFLSSGVEEGFILGSVYAGDVTPPSNNGNERVIVFSDDTEVRYDRKKHEMYIKIGATEIKSNPTSTMIKSASITLDGNVHITGTTQADADMTCNAKVTASTDCIGGGKSLVGHTHTGNMGSPTSSPN